MTLKYVGPKPLISHTGIEFDKNKEDKYIYLGIVTRLIEALDHKYIEDKVYIYNDEGNVSENEILHTLNKYCPNIDELLDKNNHCVEEYMQHDLQRAHESKTLNAMEKEVLINNIELMHDYMLQRSVNKNVYYCAMKVLADIISRDHIDYVTTPFVHHYMHVLHSLQGTLVKEKAPIDTKLDIFEKDKKLFVKLQVINILNKS